MPCLLYWLAAYTEYRVAERAPRSGWLPITRLELSLRQVERCSWCGHKERSFRCDFFYTHTLNQKLVIERIPFPRRERKLPLISNHRLRALENGRVSFEWKDAHHGQRKIMTFDAVEFMRRFLLHVLPSGLVRVRQFIQASFLRQMRRQESSVFATFMRSTLELQPRLKSDHTRGAIAT
jgi:hypothetical protein